MILTDPTEHNLGGTCSLGVKVEFNIINSTVYRVLFKNSLNTILVATIRAIIFKSYLKRLKTKRESHEAAVLLSNLKKE